MIDAAVRDLVWQRAERLCEYCHIAQEADSYYTFHVEHVIASQHGGTDHGGNLALSCPYCNRYKGPNLSGLDPDTGQLTRLFHPRNDSWDDHFVLREHLILGLTPVGRTTVSLLRMNEPVRVALRQEWE